MFHAVKTPAMLAVCLATASACASATTSQPNALAAQTEASPAIETAALPQASPIDLELLAALAHPSDLDAAMLSQTNPIEKVSKATGASRVVPATVVTYRTEAPIQLDTDIEYTTQTLPVVPHDSDLLKGTVYDSEADRTMRKPLMTPGTYRTVEYKN